MNFKKFFLVFLLGTGLLACSDSNDTTDGGVTEGTPTYVSLSVTLPGAKSQKALPGDYNPDGDYEGQDVVHTLDVYMVGMDKTFESKRFTSTEISTDGSVISTSQPFRTVSGRKTVYIVVNSPNALLTTGPLDNDLWPVAGMATIENIDGTNYDKITMTGKTENVVIEPDVTAQAVINGANRVAVQLNRLASRAIVTTSATPEIKNEDGVVIGTLSNITYSVAQGTNQIYFLPQADYVTWGSSYIPPSIDDYETNATKYYDYSDLSTPTTIPAKPVAGDGYKSLPGKFLFENTHTSGDVKSSGYKKGNTAYVLVKTIFTPAASAIADGGTLTNGTFYVGQTDGKIYSTKQAAQTAIMNQKVSAYIGGKMLYYAWLNPDDIATPINSPVIRNNIYHVNVTGFGKLGWNWNPLFPENPDNPNPENPDPKPVNPDEPEPPVDPTDPLTPEQTYMSVDITILNWTVHSYDIEL